MKTIEHLPIFSTIQPADVQLEVERRLTQNRSRLHELLAQEKMTWENLMLPLEEMQDNVHNYWALISHMNAVVNSEALRAAYNACLPLLSEYFTDISHNEKLYQAINSIKESSIFKTLEPAQQKVIHNELRDFKLAGVTLNGEKKQQFATLVAELTQLGTKFEENVLDATMSWKKQIVDEALLVGIPESFRHQARERARSEKQKGWLFTLEPPSYHAVISFADTRSLREEIYRAHITRASDLSSPDSKKWDNTHVMQQILCKRSALAKLLDFPNFANLSLATKMVKEPKDVLDFLQQLAHASKEKGKQEFQELTNFAKEQLGLEKLEPWDIAYASEKKRHHFYDISQETLRPYLAEPNVMDGLFLIVEKLFRITPHLIKDADTWHPEVQCYAFYDENKTLVSYCYFDLYSRPNKRGGAWMDDCQIRRKLANGNIQIPIAFVTCNFTRPTENRPALFSHDEVLTLFHEVGHALQHMLTKVDYGPISGIQGIPWDAVEVASQFLENWAWQKESLLLFAKHYETGETLPEALFEKMFNAKNFQSAMLLLRQLEFSLFDFMLHLKFDENEPHHIQKILDDVRREISVIPIADFNRFQHSFSHIFSGGYAAGYYSYKWAEVMSSDAFSLFLERGIFDAQTAKCFRQHILEPGGSEDPAILFKRYRGRDPSIEALLHQTGIN